MSPTTTAPDPTAPATVAFAPDDLQLQDQPADVTTDDAVEREKLRLEFEAIIAAGYGGGADEPRPAPPSLRVAVIVGGRRPAARPTVPIGTVGPVRLRPAPTAGPAPRERGPPVPGPHGWLCAPAQLPVQQQRPPRFPPRPQAAPSRRPWTGSGRAGVRRHQTSTAGGCTSPRPHRARTAH